MKRWIKILAVMAIIAVACSGCTQNGGHIGKIFGRWHLERIEADGSGVVPAQRGEIFWAFQGEMFQMQLKWSDHAVSTIFGNYTLSDDTLLLSFPEDNNAPFEDLGLGRENSLHVVKLTGKEMVLTYHPEDGATLTYYLRKW